MVVKVYISGISGNKEVKKRQQRVLMILDSKNIKYEIIDITEPGREADKDFMQNNSKSNGGTVSDPNPRSPLPPQVFNDEEYCGDYDLFDLANEVDTLEQFVKVEAPPEEIPTENKTGAVNGEVQASDSYASKDDSQDIEGTGNSTEKLLEAKDSSVDNDSSDVVAKAGSEEKEVSLEKEQDSPTRQKSEEDEQPTAIVEKTIEESEIKPKKISEDDEIVNENGVVSSREQSEEKEEPLNDQKKENPSESLIQSEQAVAND